MKITTLFAMLLWVLLAGCTSMQPLAGNYTTLSRELEAGDRIVVQEQSGTTHDVEFADVDPTHIHAITEDGEMTYIGFDDIDRIEARRLDGTRTALLVVGTAATVAVMYTAAEAAALGSILGATP